MKAIVYHSYGSADVLKLAEVEKPTPKEEQIQIKVHVVALNAADKLLMLGKPAIARLGSGLRKPKNPILGADVAGVVTAVGANVTQFKVGDEVFGDLSECGFGGLAEYACGDAEVFALKGSEMSFETAAALPMASVTALQGLRDKGEIEAGQKVLINGASGGVGTYAVQIANALGAEVTGVCSSGKMEMVRSLGADHVIDYTREDFTKNGEQYDLILAANGDRSVSDYLRALAPNGTVIVAGGSMPQLFQMMLFGSLATLRNSKKTGTLLAKPKQADLLFVRELVEAGKVTPVIDRQYTLENTPAAFRYLAEGHAKGKVIITID